MVLWRQRQRLFSRHEIIVAARVVAESSASAITRNAADRFARLERCLFPFDFLAVRVDDALLFPLYIRFCSELASDTATQPEKRKDSHPTAQYMPLALQRLRCQREA